MEPGTALTIHIPKGYKLQTVKMDLWHTHDDLEKVHNAPNKKRDMEIYAKAADALSSRMRLVSLITPKNGLVLLAGKDAEKKEVFAKVFEPENTIKNYLYKLGDEHVLIEE